MINILLNMYKNSFYRLIIFILNLTFVNNKFLYLNKILKIYFYQEVTRIFLSFSYYKVHNLLFLVDVLFFSLMVVNLVMTVMSRICFLILLQYLIFMIIPGTPHPPL